MDEKEFKKHLQDLVRGHHHPDEHDWDETGKTAGQSGDGKAPLAAKRKPAKRARTSRAKLKRAAG